MSEYGLYAAAVCSVVLAAAAISRTDWKPKVKWSLTALVGLLTISQLFIYRKALAEQSLAGRYQWQWAGENWLGKVNLTAGSGGNLLANLKMTAVRKLEGPEGPQLEERPVLESDPSRPGWAKVGPQGLRLYLPIRDLQPRLGEAAKREGRLVLVDAQLSHVEAYAGIGEYHGLMDDGKTTCAEGDIILVKYASGGVKPGSCASRSPADLGLAPPPSR